MSNVIDERIVSMEFDNDRFEKNISQTMKSLENLDDQIDDAAKNVSNSFIDVEDGLSRLDLVFAGFYQKIGGYLADLTMNVGKFAKSLSFDQVQEGFSKYTAETLAVQTIYSNTENSIEHIYDVLGDLLDYTDKTSYHYDKMADTVSKFANKGVELEQAEQAVKGIANWAAISGAGIAKADYAMDALVKAFSNGVMQQREWITISKTANMDTAQFMQTVIDTGKAMAEAGKASEKWYEITLDNFATEEGVFGRNRLLTTDVLMTVLKEYGDETSELGQRALAAASEAKTFEEALGAVKDAVSTGYGTSFKYLFGNYDEARKFWTFVQDAMLDVFTIGTKFRNDVLEAWHISDIGGWKELFDALQDFWEGVKGLVQPISDAFHDIFGFTNYNKTAKYLADATKKFKEFAKSVKDTYGVANDIRTAFEMALNGDTLDDLLSEDLVKSLAEALQNEEFGEGFSDELKAALQNIIDGKELGYYLTEDLSDALQKAINGEKIEKSVSKSLKLTLQKAINDGAFKNDFADRLAEIFSRDESGKLKAAFASMAETGANLTFSEVEAAWGTSLTPALTILDSIGSTAEGIFSVFKIGYEIFVNVGKAIGDIAGSAIKVLKPVVKLTGYIGRFITKVKDAIVNSGIITTIFESFSKIVTSILNPAIEWFNELLDKAGKKANNTDKFEKLEKVLSDIAKKIESITDLIVNKGIKRAFEWLGESADKVKEKLQPFGEVIKDVGKVIKNVFGKGLDDEGLSTAGTVLDNFMTGFENFGDFILNSAVLPTLGFFGDVFKDLWEVVKKLGPTFDTLRESLGKLFKSITGEDGLGAISKLLEGVLGFLSTIVDFILNKGVIPALDKLGGFIDTIREKTTPLGTALHDAFEEVGKFLQSFGTDTAQCIVDVLTSIWQALKKIYDWASKALSPVWEWFSQLFSTTTFAEFLSMLNSVLTGVFLINLIGFASNLKSVGEAISDFAASLTKTKGAKTTIKDVAKSLLMLGIAIKMMTSIESDKFYDIITALTGFVLPMFVLAVKEMNGLSAFMTGINNKKTVLSISPVISNVTELGLAMIALAAALKILASVDFTKESSLIAIAVLDSFLLLTGGIIKSMQKAKPKQFKTVANAVIKIAEAMLILVVAVRLLGGMEDDMKRALDGLRTIAFILTAMVALIGKFGPKDDLPGGILVYVLAIEGLALIVKQMANIPNDDIRKGVIAVGALEVLLTVLAAMGTKYGGNTFKNSLSIGLLIADLAGMVLVLKEVASIPWEVILAGLRNVGVAIAALAALVGVMSLAEHFGNVSKVLESFGSVLKNIGIAVLAFAAAIDLLALGMVKFMPTIQENAPKIEAGMKAFFRILTIAIGSQIPALVNAVLIFISTIIAGLFQYSYVWAYQVCMLIVQVLKGVNDAINELAEIVVQLLATLLNAVANAIDRNSGALSEAVVNLAKSLLKLLWKGLMRAIGELTVGARKLVKLIAEEIFGAQIDDEAFEIGNDAIRHFLNGTEEEVGKHKEVYYENGHKIIRWVADGVAEETPKATEDVGANTAQLMEAMGLSIDTNSAIPLDKMQALFGNLSNTVTLDNLKDAEGGIAGLISAMGIGVDANGDSLITKFNELVANVSNPVTDENKSDAEDNGEDVVEAFVNGISNKYEIPIDKAREMVDGLIANLVPKKAEEATEKEANKIPDAIAHTLVSTGAKETLTGARDVMMAPVSNLYTPEVEKSVNTSGLNFVSGFAESLRANTRLAETAARNMARLAITAFNNEQDSHSPSRVMMKSGNNFVEGLVLGIEALVGLVGDSAMGLADSAIDNFNSAIQNGVTLNLFNDDNPVIKPVLDLSDIRRGAGEIPGIFSNGYSLGVAAAGIGSAQNSPTSNPVFNFTINASEGQSAEDIARAVMNEVNMAIKQRGSIWR